MEEAPWNGPHERRCDGLTASMMSVVPLLSAAFTLMCLRVFGSSSMSYGAIPIPHKHIV